MSDVRANAGVPVLAQFLGISTPSACAPIVVDSTTGFIYSLKTGDVVTLAGGGAGTVTTVSVVTANGVSGSVANPTSTPAITLTLGAIAPTSVAASGALSGSNFSGSSSGTNTGDQTTATTQAIGDNSTKFATTAYVDRAAALSGTSWTPTDQSGASLTFSAVSANYLKIGNMVFAYGTLTYPVTADASSARISLPVAVPNQAYAEVAGATTVNGGTDTIGPYVKAIKNTSTMGIYYSAPTGAGFQTNVTFSAAVLTFMIIYPAA